MKKNLFVFVFLLAASPAFAGAINVSCTDSVKSLNKVTAGSFAVVCPVNCMTGSVWGTGNLFTTDSAICVAAVHEGAIKNSSKGGWVKVTTKPGQGSYNGAGKNGVNTQSWGSYDSSFSVSP